MANKQYWAHAWPIQVFSLTCALLRHLGTASFSIFDPIEFVFSDKFEFGSKFRTSSSKSEQKRFSRFPTVFYFSTCNSEYPEFEIRFKPNLAP